MSFSAMQVGVGAMGQAWLSVIASLPGVEVVGLVDVNKDSLKEQAKKHNLGEEICPVEMDWKGQECPLLRYWQKR